ncbi:hypothetical protein RRF57_011787 [Xylaria bambusicola]|uniref:Aflatoxin regulatory protein domain-containing protein n=1 Tax=Xylaria bambusicola TaxID=326684 RepID=A0AAN7UNF0_9PEZI
MLRVGKVPGVRARKKEDPIQKQARKPTQAHERLGFLTSPTSNSICVATELEHHEQSPAESTSWGTDWQLEPSNTATVDLMGDLDTCGETVDGSSGSTGSVLIVSHDEPCILSPEANLDSFLFQMPTPFSTDQLIDTHHVSNTPVSLVSHARSEGDSQCCLECCQMISDLENYIEAELKAFRILLGIVRRALGRLSELITSQMAPRNARCILLFTTLIYQILELLEAFPSLIREEVNRQRDRNLAGSYTGVGLGDFAMDAEEQSAFRIQSTLKEVHHATEVLGKLRALSTGSTGSANSGDSGSRNHSYLDLELRFRELVAQCQKSE